MFSFEDNIFLKTISFKYKIDATEFKTKRARAQLNLLMGSKVTCKNSRNTPAPASLGIHLHSGQCETGLLQQSDMTNFTEDTTKILWKGP